MQKEASVAELLAAEGRLDRAVTRVYRRILLISRFFYQAVNDMAARHGLSSGECLLLLTLNQSGPSGVRPTALYRSLQVTSGTVTKRLQRLDELGLVKRTANAKDGRSIRASLTRKGRALVRTIYSEKSDISIASELMDDAETAELDRLLEVYLSKAEQARRSRAAGS